MAAPKALAPLGGEGAQRQGHDERGGLHRPDCPTRTSVPVKTGIADTIHVFTGSDGRGADRLRFVAEPAARAAEARPIGAAAAPAVAAQDGPVRRSPARTTRSHHPLAAGVVSTLRADR